MDLDGRRSGEGPSALQITNNVHIVVCICETFQPWRSFVHTTLVAPAGRGTPCRLEEGPWADSAALAPGVRGIQHAGYPTPGLASAMIPLFMPAMPGGALKIPSGDCVPFARRDFEIVRGR